MHRIVHRAAAAIAALSLAAAPFAAVAGNYTFSDTIPITLEGSGITLEILAGSSADSLIVDSTTLTVEVAGGESLTVRYPSPAGTLANDGGLSSCTNVGGNNQVVVTGPRTVTFTPSASPACPVPSGGGGGGGGGGGASVAPTLTVVSPNGGESLAAGTNHLIQWSSNGGSQIGVSIKLSTDGGLSYPTVIDADDPNDGIFDWTVPDAATSAARIRIESKDVSGAFQAADASNGDFSIIAASGVVEPSETIDEDKSLEEPPAEEEEPSPPPLCVAGTRVKSPLFPAVYYCGKDGKRYVFPNPETYFSWFPDFKGIITLDPGVLAQIRIGGNVTFRPGTLVKVQTDPKVYVVSKGGVLRWVTTEELAIAIFGSDWNKKVHDVPDVFFINYVIGEPITSVPTTSLVSAGT